MVNHSLKDWVAHVQLALCAPYLNFEGPKASPIEVFTCANRLAAEKRLRS
jgi:hypothetical protein